MFNIHTKKFSFSYTSIISNKNKTNSDLFVTTQLNEKQIFHLYGIIYKYN